MTNPFVVSVCFIVFTDTFEHMFSRHKLYNPSGSLITLSRWKLFQSKNEILEFKKFIKILTLTVGLCSHSVEKTKQCHIDSSVFQSGDLMRKKHIHLKVPFRKGGRAVTLSDDASFLSAILNEGPELSFTSSLSLMPLLLYCMHTHRKNCTHACALSLPCTDANCSKMLMPVIILETPLSSLQQLQL